MAKKQSQDDSIVRLALVEWPLFASVSTTLLFSLFGATWLGDLSSTAWFAFIFIWLFAVMLASAFAIVRHAESLAELLGEPFGTLVLTLSVIGVEVLMISAVMLTGKEQPTIARDTMFSVVMALLGGMTGISLLLGGLRHHEQDYNLQGANAYLALIIPLAVIGLILPNFTTTTEGPTLSQFQSIFTAVMSIGIYGIFLAVQTSRYRSFFVSPEEETAQVDLHGEHEVRSTPFHSILLIAYILPLVLLAKQFATPLEYGTRALNAPPVLSGFLVALIILAPEALSAVRAALRNQLQRSVNILLGSVLATIGLTVPAVLLIGLITGKPVHLGLSNVNSILLVMLLGVSTLTFSNLRTNALLGAVHLLMFLAFLMLMFQG
jgi:Ca2+/H+ antiporter